METLLDYPSGTIELKPASTCKWFSIYRRRTLLCYILSERWTSPALQSIATRRMHRIKTSAGQKKPRPGITRNNRYWPMSFI